MAGLLETLFPYLDNAKVQAIANVKAAYDQAVGTPGVPADPLGAAKGIGQGVAHGVASGADAIGNIAQQAFGVPSTGTALADAVDKVSGYNPSNPDAAGSGGVGEMLSNLVNPPAEKGAALAGILLGPMAKNVDLNMMKRAEEMIRNGAPISQVFKETNWAPTASGRTAGDLALATELPMHNMQIDPAALGAAQVHGISVPLEDIIGESGDPLFAQHPELRSAEVRSYRATDPYNAGSTDPGTNQINLIQGSLPDQYQPEKLPFVLTHELQHNVDYANNRLAGTNGAAIASRGVTDNQEQDLAKQLLDQNLLRGYAKQDTSAMAAPGAHRDTGFLTYLLNGGEVNGRNAPLRDRNPALQDFPFEMTQDVKPRGVLHFGGSAQAKQAVVDALARLQQYKALTTQP